jgi:hypothetical protein
MSNINLLVICLRVLGLLGFSGFVKEPQPFVLAFPKYNNEDIR